MDYIYNLFCCFYKKKEEEKPSYINDDYWICRDVKYDIQDNNKYDCFFSSIPAIENTENTEYTEYTEDVVIV